MLKKNSKVTGMSSPARPTTGGGRGGGSEAAGWEVRPGGMLVQKRSSDQNSVPIPKIKVRVKNGSSYHEVNISPQASFGELKKMLAGPTGMHPQDQKLIYREKERDSKAFLDVAGVQDGSKLVLIEDVIRKERRVLESRKNDKKMDDKASKAIAEIGLEVDKLAKKVTSLESEIYGGKRVAETVLSNSIELLMTQLLKLDEIVADGDAKLQRREQVRRVQKYIETLDMLKIKNTSSHEVKALILQQQQKQSTEQQRNLKWGTYGSSGVAAPPPFSSSSSSSSSSTENNFQFPFVNGNSHFQFPYGRPAEYV